MNILKTGLTRLGLLAAEPVTIYKHVGDVLEATLSIDSGTQQVHSVGCDLLCPACLTVAESHDPADTEESFLICTHDHFADDYRFYVSGEQESAPKAGAVNLLHVTFNCAAVGEGTVSTSNRKAFFRNADKTLTALPTAAQDAPFAVEGGGAVDPPQTGTILFKVVIL